MNDLMEKERRLAIKEELRKEQEEAAKRMQFAKTLKEQIIENEEQRILEFERKQEESRLINLKNIAWQQDEIEKLRNKEAENVKVRQELAEANEQLKHFKAMEQEENRIIDQRLKVILDISKLRIQFFTFVGNNIFFFRIQDYHRLKEEREIKKIEEQRLEKLRKEREKSRVATRTMQTHELQV